jgi:hypothetical protein
MTRLAQSANHWTRTFSFPHNRINPESPLDRVYTLELDHFLDVSLSRP